MKTRIYEIFFFLFASEIKFILFHSQSLLASNNKRMFHPRVQMNAIHVIQFFFFFFLLINNGFNFLIILQTVFAAIFTTKISICSESWPLSWWHSNSSNWKSKRFTRCSRFIERIRSSWYTMLLYIGTIYRCQIWCACSKNWK